MRYPHILAALRSAKWAVQPATLEAIRSLLSSRLTADRADPLHAGAITPPARRADHHAPTVPAPVLGGTAVIRFFGICAKRISAMEADCGGVSLETLQQELALAVANPRVSRIVLHIDSPGGTITGIPELVTRLREWSQIKPIYAFADNLCASAAYWLSTGCTALFATPTADLGSIGVYMAVIDESEAFAEAGYRMVLIKAGERKAEGARGLPIEPETIARWQAEVDAIYAQFTAAVLAVRPGVADSTMQGQAFMGTEALALGLCDQLVTDLDDLLAQLAAA
jgi:signal peptide peptidase SppA